VASEFRGRPRYEKGALLVYESDEANAQPSQRIVFAYNPEQLRRTFAARAPAAQPQRPAAAREDVLRVPGPPVETITISILLDAADQLEHPQSNRPVVENGLHPALARLELLLYPSTARMSQIEQQAAEGEVQVAPANVPLVMLAWGKSRVVPVQITSFGVTEEQFDPSLNPIRARVELGLRVLTYMEFRSASAGRDAYMGYQRKKEQLAALPVGGPS
jgi:Contractile injection system tube protein